MIVQFNLLKKIFVIYKIYSIYMGHPGYIALSTALVTPVFFGVGRKLRGVSRKEKNKMLVRRKASGKLVLVGISIDDCSLDRNTFRSSC